MSIRFGAIGGGFQHVSSTHPWKKPEHFEWKYGDTAQQATFYIDWGIVSGISDRTSVKKYAWILESRAIISGINEFIIKNVDSILEEYEMIFTCDKDLLALGDKFKWTPANGTWIENPRIPNKTKIVSMITSNKKNTEQQRYRCQMADIYQKSEEVDVFGRGYNFIETKEQGLEDYMFSISIENSSYGSYFTEKILDCFAMGTMPVYLGDPDIGEHFNMDGIIILDESFKGEMLTKELYYSRIEAIRDNLQRVSQYNTIEDWICKNYPEVLRF